MANLQVSIERYLAHDTFHQRRLTLAVLTNKGHLLASLDGQVHVVEHHVVICLPDVLANDGIVATSQTGRKLQVHSRIVHLVNLDRHDFLQLLHFLLHLHSLRGLIAETVDELLHIGYLLLLVFVGSELLFATFLAQYDIFVVLHLVVDNLSARYLQCPVRHIINKCAVVTHQHNGIGTCGQELLQPLDRLNVQMVGGLVQQQHIGFTQ